MDSSSEQPNAPTVQTRAPLLRGHKTLKLAHARPVPPGLLALIVQLVPPKILQPKVHPRERISIGFENVEYSAFNDHTNS
jgi:hypothetical protein